MIIKNPDEYAYKSILQSIKENEGYCPCVLKKSDDTKCPCKKFREEKECSCGLYVKIEEHHE